MGRSRRWKRWLCLAALAAGASSAVLVPRDGGDGPAERSTAEAVTDVVAPPSGPAAPAAALEPAIATGRPAEPVVQLVTEPATAPAGPAPPPSDRDASFAERHPVHAAARQDPGDPTTTRWALLIGINRHRGGVADNVGSRQDAEDLRAHLLASGWRDDHILVLTDLQATRAEIIAGIAWLADKTDDRSVAVFHYSGHSKKWYGRDVDGDGEVTDEGLWPTDSAFIVDSELTQLLDPVRPHALWLSFATCNAAGLADPGMAGPGRILTFSSGEPQKSYEHPGWGNSVWGWWVIEQAIAAGHGDLDRDGRVTVEEAFAWSRPRASETTRHQRHGAQDAVIVDGVEGELDLLVPGAVRPIAGPSDEPPGRPEPSHEPSSPSRSPSPGGDDPARRQEATEEPHGNRICVLCDR